MTRFDAIVIGAGPTGLACGIELKKRGVNALLIDKGCVVNSLYHYPTNMVFFTTPELLEIGDIPMTSLEREAEPHRGAEVLPARGRPLRPRRPSVRDGAPRHAARTARFIVSHGESAAIGRRSIVPRRSWSLPAITTFPTG